MSVQIQRFVVRAKPAKGHPEFHEWETACVVVFVAENDKAKSILKAEAELLRRKWQKLYYESKSTLIRDRAKQGGGEFWDAYKSAERDGLFFRVFPDHFAPGLNRIPPIRAQRVTEKFIDRVVEDIGGRRLDCDDQNRTADYLLDDWLFELKDLQQEGIEQLNRQRKLARLFSPYFPGEFKIPLDPAVLSERDWRIYLDIMGSPIQPQVKSAASQIKSTRRVLMKPELKGGLIYLNTGYGSLPPEVFEQAVERYARKDSRQFEAAICISTWSLTNGFDSEAHYKFHPTHSKHAVVEKLLKAFDKRFEEAMTAVIRGTISEGADLSNPLKPCCFGSEGIDFYWQPPIIPRTWLGEQHTDEKG